MLRDFFVWFYLFVSLWGTYPDASALSCFDLWFSYFSPDTSSTPPSVSFLHQIGFQFYGLFDIVPQTSDA